MIRNGIIGSLDGLMHELISAARDTGTIEQGGTVWEMSDAIGMHAAP